MPATDRMICVRRGDISYCWNFETCQVEIYTRKVSAISGCPEDVAHDLLLLLNEKSRPDAAAAELKTVRGGTL